MNNSKIRNMTFTALMSAALCIIAPFSIHLPFSPVPISAALFVIYLFSIILGAKKAIVGVGLYLVLGAVGLPVFTDFSGGLGKLMGPTGGYAIGYIFIALFTGIFADIFKDKAFINILGMILGTAICYALGTIWLSFSAHMNFMQAFFIGVIPYIPADMIKIIIAYTIGQRIKRYIRN